MVSTLDSSATFSKIDLKYYGASMVSWSIFFKFEFVFIFILSPETDEVSVVVVMIGLR